MSISRQELEFRQLFMPVAVVEHHLAVEPNLDVYDICNQLGKLWQEVQREAQNNEFDLETNTILSLNHRVAGSLNAKPGAFRDPDKWLRFIEELENCDAFEENPEHVLSWTFSSLYWNHLTRHKLATAWILNNALRIQYDLPQCSLSLERLGDFMDSLSGSGPPIYDGQTFYPDNYSE